MAPANRMKNPAVLVSRHPRLHERASAAWALELVLQLHGQASATRYPFQRRRPWRDHDFASDLLAELHARGIKTEIACYGPDFARFETDLRRKQKDGPAEFPVVRVPSVALADWMTAGLHVRPGIFLVGEESGEPVFLTRHVRSAAVAKVSVAQMRRLHEVWQSWPVLLPSMLLTVLWHRQAST